MLQLIKVIIVSKTVMTYVKNCISIWFIADFLFVFVGEGGGGGGGGQEQEFLK